MLGGPPGAQVPLGAGTGDFWYAGWGGGEPQDGCCQHHTSSLGCVRREVNSKRPSLGFLEDRHPWDQTGRMLGLGCRTKGWNHLVNFAELEQ